MSKPKTSIPTDDWNIIVKKIHQRECVPFLGAGVNLKCGDEDSLPLGGDVALRLLERMIKRTEQISDASYRINWKNLKQYREDARVAIKAIHQELAGKEEKPDLEALKEKIEEAGVVDEAEQALVTLSSLAAEGKIPVDEKVIERLLKSVLQILPDEEAKLAHIIVDDSLDQFQLFGMSGNWEHQLNVLRSLILLNAASNPEKINSRLDAIRLIARQRQKPSEKAVALENLSHGYVLAREFDKADAAIKDAVQQYGLANDKSNQLSAQHRVATTYLQQSAPDKAIEYLNRALEMGIKAWNGTLYASLGEAYVKKNDFTKAISFYEQAQQTFKEKGDGSSEALILIEISRVYRNQAKYDEAISALDNAITLLRSSKSYFLGSALTSLADVHHQKGDIKSAIETYHRADRLFIEEVAAPSYYRVDILTKLSELYTKTGDLKTAEDYKQRANKLKLGP